MFKLLSTSGDQSIDLQTGRTLVVGRAVTSDIPIYDPTISRRHAEVSLAADGVRIKDLGSSNGTFLNGARVTESDAAENDVVTFGKVAFRVVAVTPPSARPAIPAPVAPPAAEPTGGKAAAGGTIVRQMPVSPSGNVPAIKEISSSSGHLKVDAKELQARQAQKLKLLLDISQELSKQQELDRLLEKVVDLTFQVMNVDRVSILLLDPTTKELVPKISRSRTGDANAAKVVPQSIARKVVEDRVAILSDNTAADDRFKGKSIMIQSVRSAMCTPLLTS
ncbi:MAG TPA: FHA domain-containing protein, partial [Gemmatimonadales bacterium]